MVRRMTGTATEIKICGKTIRLGDEMEVEYTTGKKMKGGRIKGKVVELWSPELGEGHFQARLSCGWCFHNYDRIITHTSNVQGNWAAARNLQLKTMAGRRLQLTDLL